MKRAGARLLSSLRGRHPPASAELVRRARRGEADAFSQLYELYFPMIYRFVFSKTGSRSLAEDLAGETFLHAFGRLRKVSWRSSNFAAGLVGVARALVSDHYRSAARRTMLLANQLEMPAGSARDTERRRLLEVAAVQLRRGGESISDDQRTCLYLRFFAGLSVWETAVVMGRSAGGVELLERRSFRRLESLLTDEAA